MLVFKDVEQSVSQSSQPVYILEGEQLEKLSQRGRHMDRQSGIRLGTHFSFDLLAVRAYRSVLAFLRWLTKFGFYRSMGR